MATERLLNPETVRNAKPGKPLSDGGGLRLFITPKGAKCWQYRYKLAGKEQIYSIGTYPEVSLSDARKERDKARNVVAEGGDPNGDKRKAKVAAVIEATRGDDHSFARFANEALDHARATLEPVTIERWERELGRYALDHFGNWPVDQIKRGDVLAFLRPYEAKRATCHGIRRKVAEALERAIDAGVIEHNPAHLPKGRLAAEKAQTEHHAAILDPARFAQLLHAIDAYSGQPSTVACLKLAALCFVRPGEIRKARWCEIDWQAEYWNIPAARMKKVSGKRLPHSVPLSKQAVAILREQHALSGAGALIFPGTKRTKPGERRANVAPPLSENTLNNAMRRMGFAKDEMTAHGFRSSANSMALDFLEWPASVSDPSKCFDRALAHVERNTTKRAYDRSSFWAQREWLMQAWADFLDRLRSGDNVVQMRRREVAVA